MTLSSPHFGTVVFWNEFGSLFTPSRVKRQQANDMLPGSRFLEHLAEGERLSPGQWLTVAGRRDAVVRPDAAVLAAVARAYVDDEHSPVPKGNCGLNVDPEGRHFYVWEGIACVESSDDPVFQSIIAHLAADEIEQAACSATTCPPQPDPDMWGGALIPLRKADNKLWTACLLGESLHPRSWRECYLNPETDTLYMRFPMQYYPAINVLHVLQGFVAYSDGYAPGKKAFKGQGSIGIRAGETVKQPEILMTKVK